MNISQIVQNASLNELQELATLIDVKFRHLSQYRKKHPPYKKGQFGVDHDETCQEYIDRMRICDRINPLLFFKHVYEYKE